MSKNIEQLIENTADKLYPFAYSLCLDELLACQLVIDGISRFVLEHQVKPSEDNYIEVAKGLYTLAKHRHQHHNLIHQKYALFAKLSILNRAVLFLCDKLHYSAEVVAEICSVEAAQVKLALHQSRGLLQETQTRAI